MTTLSHKLSLKPASLASLSLAHAPATLKPTTPAIVALTDSGTQI